MSDARRISLSLVALLQQQLRNFVLVQSSPMCQRNEYKVQLTLNRVSLILYPDLNRNYEMLSLVKCGGGKVILRIGQDEILHASLSHRPHLKPILL